MRKNNIYLRKRCCLFMMLYEKEKDEKELYLPKKNVLFILALV